MPARKNPHWNQLWVSVLSQINKQKNGRHAAGFHICLSAWRHRWLLNFTTRVFISESSRWCTIATYRSGRYKKLNCILKIALLIWSKWEPASYLHATVFIFCFFKSAFFENVQLSSFFLQCLFWESMFLHSFPLWDSFTQFLLQSEPHICNANIQH